MAAALQVGCSAALVGFGGVFTLGFELLWPLKLPSSARGYPAKDAFVQQVASLASGNEAAASAFAQRAQEVYVQRRESAKRLEDKAATILSFVGGGSGLIALAAGTEKIVRVQPTPLLVTACLFLFAVFVTTILVQAPRASGVFNARQLCDPALLRSSAGTARIAAISGWEYLEAGRLMAIRVREKAQWLTYSQIAFAFGIAAIVLNVLITAAQTPPTDAPRGTAVHCNTAANTMDCRIAPAKITLP